MRKSDAVNGPKHYHGTKCIETIEFLGLNFHLGSALKYLWRTGRKAGASGSKDLEKARWYIDRELARRNNRKKRRRR